MSSQKSSKFLVGAWFWLKWIAIGAAGFLISIAFWNWLLIEALGADFSKPLVTIFWFTAVFGTWFSILVWLMRKKGGGIERLDPKSESTVLWWLIWIGLTIGTFFLSVWFWTPFIAEHFGSIKESSNSIIWVVAVFGTWLIALIPLMTFMYQKVDMAYEQGRKIRLDRGQLPALEGSVRVRAVMVDESKRWIPKELSKKLEGIPPTVKNGHLVTAILKDGRRIENIFIAGQQELLGLYDVDQLTFTPEDITDLEPADLTHPPDFTKKSWLRLDGEAA